MRTIFTTLFLMLAVMAVAQPGGDNRPRRNMYDPANPDVHDPVMAYENGKYYMFTTGFGVGVLSSEDMVNWKREKGVLNPVPEWAREEVPGYNGHTWAPDVIRVGDLWYLYYSCSSFGKNTSAIGVAVNKTLNPESADFEWKDLGKVIQSKARENNWNAIDPNLILDTDGTPWLTFGSFWDGIQLVKLEKDMKTPVGTPKTIARRKANGGNPVEAPFMIYRDGYFYLFVSFDYCCKGLNSNYKVAVGRSKTIDGPFVDAEGKDMAQGGGNILVGESEQYAGVGHCGVYEFNGKWYMVAHGYDKQKNGASKLFLRELKWQDGWPSL